MENIKALLESSKYPTLGTSDTASMKLLLENTNAEHARLVNEGTLTGDIAQFTPILLPMVRRVYPNLIANELLGVQPMPLPTGFIYAMTNHYLGSSIAPISRTNTIIVDYVLTPGALTGGLLPVGSTVAGNVSLATGTISYVDAVNNKAVITVTAGVFSTLDVAASLTQANGTTASAGSSMLISSVYTNEAAFGNIISGYTGTYSTAQAEVLGADMREVGFSIDRKNVTAVSRALKGQYTVEMYQDLKSQHGLQADEEIMSLMSYEMQAEMDREVVDFVNANSTQLPNTAFGATVGTDGRWEIERFRAQAIRISSEAAQIGIATKRGQGNVLIVSPKVATMLEQVGSFKTATVDGSVKAPTSGGVAGVFDGRYKVIVDQYAASDYCTVMYKGQDRRDAMGFFCPHVPMSFTKVTSSLTGQPAVIAKSRYALETIPGVSSALSNDRAQTYARSFGVSFLNTVLA